MSDAYRTNQPKVIVTNGMCIVIEQIAAVVKYPTEINVFLKNGEIIHAAWPASSKDSAENAFKVISDAVQEFMR